MNNDDVAAILCAPWTALHTAGVVSGSVKMPCSGCTIPLAVSPYSQRILKSDKAVVIVCDKCGGLEYGDAEVAPISKEQEAEIKGEMNRRFGKHAEL